MLLSYPACFANHMARSAPNANGTSVPAEYVGEAEKTAEPKPSQPAPRRARARRNIVSRFKGFDADDDDESSIPTSSRPAPIESQIDSAPRTERSQRYSVSPTTA